MSLTAPPSTVEMPFSSMLALSQECWRLRRVAASLGDRREGLACRYAVRQISALLAAQGVSIEDYSGRPWDVGMAPEVLDIIEDASLTASAARIDETVSATVLWNGAIVMRGQVIVRQCPAAKTAGIEEEE